MTDYRVLVRYVAFDEIKVTAYGEDEAKLIARRMWDNHEGDWSEANFDRGYDVLVSLVDDD
jgi:hypothetical protein